MTLAKQARVGASFIICALIAAALIAGICINTIRIGGPLETRDQILSDLLADELPPPLYVVEPWLEVSLISQHHGDQAAHLQRLESLRRDYENRKNYWADAALAEDVRQGLTAAEASADSFWAVVKQDFVPAVQRNDEAAVRAAHDQLSSLYDAHRKDVDALVVKTGSDAAALKAQSGKITYAAMGIFSVVMLAIIAIVVVASRLLRKRVMDPLVASADLMSRMADGDYEVSLAEAHRQDEIGDMSKAMEIFRAAGIEKAAATARQADVVDKLATGLEQLAAGNLAFSIREPFAAEYETLRTSFNDAVAGLDNSLRQVADAAGNVTAGSAEIRTASEDLSRRTEQQAASLEETAASTNQVTVMVAESARNASEISSSIRAAHDNAADGGKVVQDAVSAMDAIERSSHEIANIINLIDGIAFQTNLLALNAGVEAARAGDAGKGFAVVASEVRALAQRSADAAKEIKTLITASNEQVQQGVDLVGETGKVLQRIGDKIGEVYDLVEGMASSAERQAVNVQQVNGAIGDMDKMTQQNAAMVEQATACSRTLASQADRLADLVGRFQLSGRAVTQPSGITARANDNRIGQRAVAGNLALQLAPEAWTEF